MRLWYLGLLLTGCEPMTPSGNPLQPAAVAKPIPVLQPIPPTPPELPPEEEVFTISSEELHAGNTSKDEPPAPASAASNGSEGSSTEPTPAPPAPKATPPVPMQDINKAMQWPVRLVTTVPRATPPRAILGLPDGREVVVNPGSMVPDLGLVVIAIAPGSAELARIEPVGDHATIQSMTLQAQY